MMDYLKIVNAASKIQYLTDLNTYVIDQKNEFIFNHEIISIPTFMPGTDSEDTINLHAEMQRHNQLYIYENSWGLHYMGYKITADEDFTIIIGPYLESTLNILELKKQYRLDNHNSEILTDFSNQVHMLSVETAQSYATILPLFKEMSVTPNEPIEIKAASDPQTWQNQFTPTPSNENVNHLVNQRYKVETELLYAVEQGNKETATRLLHADNALFTFSERFPGQPLRRIKNLAIVLNTLLRTTAKSNQVPPILIHRISEKFAVQIENKSQLAELEKLQIQMIEEYADLIVENSLSQYSRITQTVISYIMTHYDKKIDTQELADICFTHPSHLSRKFKQETNMTITAYQQRIRMRQAKYLLKHEIIPIEEIAWIVGYDDSSYFSRVFKRETGYTPSQYREK